MGGGVLVGSGVGVKGAGGVTVGPTGGVTGGPGGVTVGPTGGVRVGGCAGFDIVLLYYRARALKKLKNAKTIMTILKKMAIYTRQSGIKTSATATPSTMMLACVAD